MKVLVIGGTGPSGTPLVQELLDRGHQITVYHRGAHEAEWSKEVEHIHGEARGEAIAIGLANRTWDASINTYGRVFDVVPALKGGKVHKLVSVSGFGVYRDILATGPDHLGLPLPIRETTPLVEDIERSRLGYLVNQAEQEIMAARAQGHFQACIFRYPRPYGPRAYPPPEWYWVKRIIDGRRRVLLPGDGMTVPPRGFVANLAHMLTLGLESPQADGHIYNAGDSQALTLRMITSLIAEALGHQWEAVPIPLAIAPQGNPYASSTHIILDTAKARAELGYEDAVHPQEATKITARWLMENPLTEEEHQRTPMYQQGGFDYDREDEVIDRYQALVGEFPAPE